MITTKDEEALLDIHIGKQIRSRRLFLGLNQTEVAEKLGVTFQQIQKYEKGKNKMTANRLYQLSLILDISINYFFEDFNRNQDSLQETGAEFTHYKKEDKRRADSMKLLNLFHKISNNRTKKKLLHFLETIVHEDVVLESSEG